MDNNEVGKRIKARRQELGLTQKAVAEAIGVSAVTVRQYEAGLYAPKTEVRAKLATVLNCSYSDLFPDLSKGFGFETASELDAKFAAIQEAAREKIEYEIVTSRHKDGSMTTVRRPSRVKINVQGLTVDEVNELKNYRDFLLYQHEHPAEPFPDDSNDNDT